MILFFSIIVLIISWVLFRKASGGFTLDKINITSYTFYTFTLWIFVGSVLAYYDLSAFDTEKFGNQSNKLNAWLIIMYMMIATPISMILINFIFKRDNHEISDYNSRPFEETKFNQKAIKFSLYGLAIVSSIVFLVDIIPRIDSIPLYNKIFSNQLFSSTDFYYQRNTTRLIEGDSVIIPILLSSIPLATYFSFSSLIDKNKKADKFFFMYFLLISLFMQIFDLSKGRVLFFLIGLLFVYLISGKKIRFRTIIFFLASAILYVGFSYWYFMGTILESVNIFSLMGLAIEAVYGRVFTGQISGFYECLMQFPKNHPHIGFASTGRFLHQLFGLDYSPNYGILLINLMNSTSGMIKSGIGHYTTFFLGEAWANFGIIGIIIAPFIVGINIQIIQISFLSFKKTPLTISIYVSIMLSLPILQGFREFYYPMWLLQNLLIVFILILIAALIDMATKSTVFKEA